MKPNDKVVCLITCIRASTRAKLAVKGQVYTIKRVSNGDNTLQLIEVKEDVWFRSSTFKLVAVKFIKTVTL